jgi:trehalose 6-phosphate synthase/phosphatase
MACRSAVPNNRLLIVSNRLPITATVSGDTVSFTQASGGLATGLRGCHERTDGLWIGWPGIDAPPSPLQSALDTQLAERGIVAVHLTREEVRQYYEEFSNGVLWPLFHYLLDRLPLGPTSWSTYEAVNRRFADAAIARYQPGDLIWVHDYQLMLVPEMIRRRLPDARIGFFLHIPFPSAEVFRILPWRRQILAGLLGADLLGFHTFSYQQHFAAAVSELTGAEPDEDGVWLEDHRVRFGVFPMGIDAQSFTSLAASPAVDDAVAELKAQAGRRAILLGVDRLDYTKGIPRRLLAFESLLQDEALHDRIRLVQVAVPSREAVPSYQEYRSEVDGMIGRINGTYGTITAVPIHYLYQSITPEQLVALYRAADVMLVTPLRDGMNLVAKEYAASRVDGDGVLILSEFAGAAEELQEALTVNAYDTESIAAAMRHALVMPGAERRSRMRALHDRVITYDVHRWAEHFVEILSSDPPIDRRTTSDAALRDTIAAIRAASPLAILLDYDGTLVPIAATPDEAQPDGDLLQLIDALADRPNTSVLMVSGRSRDTLDAWFGALPIELWAEHGVWFKPPRAEVWAATIDEVAGEWLERARARMAAFARTTPGAFVEVKTSSVAWHYRRAARGFGAAQARELRVALSRELADLPAEILEGKRVVEVRPRGATKAAVVSHLLARPDPPSIVVAFGDDRTDEEMFAALPRTAISIHVGGGASLATHRLRNPQAVRAFLAALIDGAAEDEASSLKPQAEPQASSRKPSLKPQAEPQAASRKP